MANCRPRWRCSWIGPATILAASLLTFSNQASAEIIIDDFDDPFEIALPPTSADTRVVQFNIGPLGVERHSSLVSISARPAGRLDANISVASALTFEIDRLNRTGLSAPTIGLNFFHYFSPLDVTQSNSNDHVLIDVAELQSTLPLARVSVFMHDPQTNFVSQQFDITSNGGPFTLAFPFDSFTERGGGQSNIDLTRIRTLHFTISPLRFAAVDDASFRIVVDRIRFASLVPELSASLLTGIGVLFGSLLSRCRRGYHEKRGEIRF